MYCAVASILSDPARPFNSSTNALPPSLPNAAANSSAVSCSFSDNLMLFCFCIAVALPNTSDIFCAAFAAPPKDAPNSVASSTTLCNFCFNASSANAATPTAAANPATAAPPTGSIEANAAICPVAIPIPIVNSEDTPIMLSCPVIMGSVDKALTPIPIPICAIWLPCILFLFCPGRPLASPCCKPCFISCAVSLPTRSPSVAISKSSSSCSPT